MLHVAEHLVIVAGGAVHGHGHVPAAEVMRDRVAGGAAITKVSGIALGAAGPGSQLGRRDEPCIVGAGIGLGLGGDLGNAGSALAGGWCHRTEHRPAQRRGVERGINHRLAVADASAGALLDHRDGLLQLSGCAAVQAARHGDRSTVPDVDAVSLAKALQPHQHPIAGCHGHAVDRAAGAAEADVALRADAAAVLPGQALD